MLRAGVTVGTWTMGSRVLGLVRDIVFANAVGASANADAFFVAFKIPNFLRRLFGEARSRKRSFRYLLRPEKKRVKSQFSS
jgi:Uncharacterized membrane protein, putative virulence factor